VPMGKAVLRRCGRAAASGAGEALDLTDIPPAIQDADTSTDACPPGIGTYALPSWGATSLLPAMPMLPSMPSALPSSRSISLGVCQGRLPAVEAGVPPPLAGRAIR